MFLSATRHFYLVLTLCFAPLLTSASPAPAAPRARPATLPQCSQVHLLAAYLAQTGAQGQPGFLLRIVNDSGSAVTLAKPFPTSAHWYARNPAGRWNWRASTGSGGALLDALRERGPVVAYPPNDLVAPELLRVPAHGSFEVEAPFASDPILRFRPGCERCRNPGEDTYQAVLAYAYLPGPQPHDPDLLSCGLRSNLVIMPPLH